MFTRLFWADAGERAVKTAAQVAIGLLVGSTAGLLGLDWLSAGSTIGTAVVVSILTSLVGTSGVLGDKGQASFLTLRGRHEA